MVEIKEVQKSYGTGKNSHIALNNINLSFRENDFSITLLGVVKPSIVSSFFDHLTVDYPYL